MLQVIDSFPELNPRAGTFFSQEVTSNLIFCRKTVHKSVFLKQTSLHFSIDMISMMNYSKVHDKSERSREKGSNDID